MRRLPRNGDTRPTPRQTPRGIAAVRPGRYKVPPDRTLPMAVQSIVSFGPDPFGAMIADNVQGIYGADLAGYAGQPGMIKVPTTGLAAPLTQFLGDLGPIQGRGGPVHLRSTAGIGTARWTPRPAYPNASAPISIQDKMGALGI
jgi:hypothetical protein